MIKANGISPGASYNFNVNWNPGWSHYLGVSHYESHGAFVTFFCGGGWDMKICKTLCS